MQILHILRPDKIAASHYKQILSSFRYLSFLFSINPIGWILSVKAVGTNVKRASGAVAYG